ncbi:hypothetical protein [Acetobacter senegalensis]|uniref:hypothetical protein n=1 Tax=Acetobacter senegalensis TaxID=446692 RepID=UPI001EDDA9F2|nr:hypothetical protein [Acetobacter senegalensis]MCG4273157.1 hypothetical protein [Acetobacter senegalensis]
MKIALNLRRQNANGSTISVINHAKGKEQQGNHKSIAVFYHFTPLVVRIEFANPFFCVSEAKVYNDLTESAYIIGKGFKQSQKRETGVLERDEDVFSEREK